MGKCGYKDEMEKGEKLKMKNSLINAIIGHYDTGNVRKKNKAPKRVRREIGM